MKREFMELLEEIVFSHHYDEDTGRVVRDGITLECIYTVVLVMIVVVLAISM